MREISAIGTLYSVGEKKYRDPRDLLGPTRSLTEKSNGENVRIRERSLAKAVFLSDKTG